MGAGTKCWVEGGCVCGRVDEGGGESILVSSEDSFPQASSAEPCLYSTGLL